MTEPSRSRALLYFSGAYWDDNHVLGHELVHVFQIDIAGAQRGGLSAFERLPQWAIEGRRSTCRSAGTTPTPRFTCGTRRFATTCRGSRS